MARGGTGAASWSDSIQLLSDGAPPVAARSSSPAAARDAPAGVGAGAAAVVITSLPAAGLVPKQSTANSPVLEVMAPGAVMSALADSPVLEAMAPGAVTSAAPGAPSVSPTA